MLRVICLRLKSNGEYHTAGINTPSATDAISMHINVHKKREVRMSADCRITRCCIMNFLCCTFLIAVGSASASHTGCSDCHTRGRALKAATINDLCLSCHPANTKDHVLGVVPQKAPIGLPLDRDRKMTCDTCHEPHGKGTVGKLLRMDKATLCATCHSE